MRVVVVPAEAFEARNTTSNGPRRLSPASGSQLSVPAVLLALMVNDPLLPAVSAERSAVSEMIAAPSGSTAVTGMLMMLFSATATIGGALTTGGRSKLFTRIEL